ncbi:PAAR domain-containing protein [Stieleria varia]|uniref:PAAR motif protein n=1 Tax=Stieleria varia TaxID=2528005 RepID=A0A5C5ZZH6_9BACT|nr:PAAR domain-containing protein [Stieleria varia]TWT91743.1 PAAR motif protein [Stieleria varia]
MGQPAAKQNDTITATDTHIVMVPSASGAVPTPLPHPFLGVINDQLSSNVNIMGLPAATVDSTAENQPPHIPTPPGTSFQTTPKDKGTIKQGSQSVLINGKGAARNGDVAETCNDPADAPVGTVVAVGNVMIGD